ncbi:MAG: anhydro-N-acetylmuramic acid kinase [Planctomycetota bacterium]|nr:anhydro-N-acetylmuramic acid kinase [Planctomycetota bacterium]
MRALEERFLDPGALVAGVLSGTSADGIDVGLARIRAKEGERGLALEPPELLVYACEPYPPELARRVRSVLEGAPCSLRETALLDRDLGRAFGSAARAVADRAGIQLDLVGSHGQTVWHHDGLEDSGPATLQLGDGDFVAEIADCMVASDFRQRDVAAGGEGAPLSPLADALLFAHVPRPAAILNLGGLGNLTLLGSDGGLLAFDTGPANALLDGLARRLLAAEMDVDGAAAARGRADPGLLAELLRHPFLERVPPKSTGRDTFGSAWLDGIVASARARGLLARGPEDLFATAVDFVAATVGDALLRFAPERPRELLVAGGGARNPAQLAALARRTGIPVRSSAAVGLDPKAREALVFAVLGAACVLGIPVTHPGATGARTGRPLGKISPHARGCRAGSAG